MADIALTRVTDITSVAGRWRALEARATPFLTWSFVATAASRFSAPHLLAVRQHGQDQGLALFNRTQRGLHLHESGDSALDTIFIEHNGLLRAADTDHLLAPALRHLAEIAPVTLSGVDDAHFRAAQAAGLVTRHHPRAAPAIDLTRLKKPYIDTLSANARGQIRRAIRLCGPGLAIARAPDVATAQAWFDELVALHQTAWRARGQAGAFADPATRAFHKALVDTAHPHGNVDLLRVTTQAGTLGVLYMLRHAGHVCCYQTGFAPTASPHEKPGLVCHSHAIELYASESVTTYDLLAGPARYKSTLARDGGCTLHWFTLDRTGSLRGRARLIGEAVRRRLTKGSVLF